jgi:uridine kinase
MTKDIQIKNYSSDKTGLIFKIVESLNKILREDQQQKQPLFLSIDEQFLLKLVTRIVKNPQKSYVLGITGESASGKTTLVQNAAKALQKSDRRDLFTTISCDDYYKDASQELKEAGSYENLFMNGFSFDTPDAIDIDLMKQHLNLLKSGQSIKSPSYNFVTCESVPEQFEKNPSLIILNEGLFVLDNDVRQVDDVKIYVFTPFSIIRDRWYVRAATRGKTGNAADLQFQNVNQAAQIYIRPTMQHADIVINGLTTAEYIEEITEKIMSAIKEILVFAKDL